MAFEFTGILWSKENRMWDITRVKVRLEHYHTGFMSSYYHCLQFPNYNIC